MYTYKFRIYPNKAQELYLAQSFGNARFVYNKGLATRQEMYEKGEKVNYCTLCKILKERKEENERLKVSPSQTLQQSLRNLDRSYKNFFSKRSNYPKFKNKFSKQSISFPQSVRIEGNMTKIPKMGLMRTKIHRKVKGDIKTCTVTKTPTNKYYISITTTFDKGKPTCPQGSKVGIDVGIKEFATCSDGTVIPNNRFLKVKLRRLKKQQRRLSRKKKGSNNRNKQRLVVARHHEKVSNQRMDFLHKQSHWLSTNFHTVVREDLNIKGMVKNHCLAQAIQDVGRGMFFVMLDYKCNEVLKIDRFAPSSKQCRKCGNKKKDLKLSDRTYHCLECGHEEDRDLHASKNILAMSVA